ncbi:MAG: hypothetical protein AB2556_16965, partial [Candidatus Thiodiazotropha sp.]
MNFARIIDSSAVRSQLTNTDWHEAGEIVAKSGSLNNGGRANVLTAENKKSQGLEAPGFPILHLVAGAGFEPTT